MIFGGIDGCKAGWLLVTYTANGYEWQVMKTITQLHQLKDQTSRIFIDMPIGLASKGHPRTIESLLRKELGSRRSTVFNAPVKAAVYEKDRQKAKAYNKQIEGKSLSEQSLNIKDKIHEVALFLAQQSTEKLHLIESHPELSFKYLNEGTVLQSKKSTKLGIEERLNLLQKYDPRCELVYHDLLAHTRRKEVKADDIVDAICLCLVNKLNGNASYTSFRDDHREDESGIPIEVAYYDPHFTP